MGAESNESSALAELEESRREIRRLRELLIAKDAELGEARGRVTQLEQSSLRLSHLLTFALMLVGRVMDVARAGLRRLRG
jgi:hypothetical protein